jgi:hypothetical protein
MTLHFSCVPVEDMEIRSATSDGLSFVISHESRGGPGFQGPPGFVANWRQLARQSGWAAHPSKRSLRRSEPAEPCLYT